MPTASPLLGSVRNGSLHQNTCSKRRKNLPFVSCSAPPSRCGGGDVLVLEQPRFTRRDLALSATTALAFQLLRPLVRVSSSLYISDVNFMFCAACETYACRYIGLATLGGRLLILLAILTLDDTNPPFSGSGGSRFPGQSPRILYGQPARTRPVPQKGTQSGFRSAPDALCLRCSRLPRLHTDGEITRLWACCMSADNVLATFNEVHKNAKRQKSRSLTFCMPDSLCDTNVCRTGFRHSFGS